MKNLRSLPALLPAFGALLLLGGCSKTERDTPTPTVSFAEEQRTAALGSYAQAACDDALRLAGEVQHSLQASAAAAPVTSSCAQVSVDRMAHVLTLDFGTAGCAGVDGRVRKGRISATYQGDYQTVGSQTVVTFTNYSVDNNGLSGTVALSGASRNAAGNIQFSVAIANGSLTLADGSGTLLADLVRTTEWPAGSSTATVQDDAFAIVNTGTLTWRNGTAYALTTPLPLLVQGACFSQGIVYPVSGALSFKAPLKPAFGLDYGTGGCDKTATLSVGTATQVITLP